MLLLVTWSSIYHYFMFQHYTEFSILIKLLICFSIFLIRSECKSLMFTRQSSRTGRNESNFIANISFKSHSSLDWILVHAGLGYREATISQWGPCASNRTIPEGTRLTDPASFASASELSVLTKGVHTPTSKVVRCSSHQANPCPAASHHQLAIHHCTSGANNSSTSQCREGCRSLWGHITLTFQREVLGYALARPLAQS